VDLVDADAEGKAVAIPGFEQVVIGIDETQLGVQVDDELFSRL
jgi:hypothetical protein